MKQSQTQTYILALTKPTPSLIYTIGQVKLTEREQIVERVFIFIVVTQLFLKGEILIWSIGEPIKINVKFINQQPILLLCKLMM